MPALTRRLAPIALALGVALAPTLAGCVGNPIETIIEGATGGNVDLGGPALPEGYPAADVPVIEGEVLFGGSIGGESGRIYNVTVKVAGEASIADIRSQLEAAGFTTEPGSTGATYIGTSRDWGVLVVVTQDGDNGWVANYTVTSAD